MAFEDFGDGLPVKKGVHRELLESIFAHQIEELKDLELSEDDLEVLEELKKEGGGLK